MIIIDGKAIANKKLEELKKKVAKLPRAPKLAIVTKGDDPATAIYIRKKSQAAENVGIKIQVVPVISQIDPDTDGIIIQLPYPNADEEINKIPLEKDVDGLTGKSNFLPATVKAVFIVIARTQSEAKGTKQSTYVIVGQGKLVGKPLANYLEKTGCKVIRCDDSTPNLKEQTLLGDILVVATGLPNIISKDMVKPGAVVIDCGSPKAEVSPDVIGVASAITPVPGGIGPLTVFSLLDNCFHACQDVPHEF